MEQRNPYIDNRIIHHIKYSRDSYSACIYCGNPADSREHIPSKTFLRKPFPENLGTVLSCKKCNNGYSLDEIFLYICIVKLKKYYFINDYEFDDDTLGRLNKYRNISKEVDGLINNMQLQDKCPYALTDVRINHVIEKLAIGHAVYELSIGCKSDHWSGKCSSIFYKFLPVLSSSEIEEIDSCFVLNNEFVCNPFANGS